MKSIYDIKDTVERWYPYPIATAFRRYRLTPENDLGGRHKLLIDLYEVALKFSVSVQLQEALQSVKNFKERLPQKEKTLEFLKHPSLGGWLGLLRTLSNLDLSASQSSGSFFNKISDWYNSTEELSPELRGAIKDLQVPRELVKSKAKNLSICDALVFYRNKAIGHGAHLEREDLIKRLPLLEGLIAELLNTASFLTEMRLFYTKEISVAEGDRWSVAGTDLCGDRDEPFTRIMTDKPALHELYVTAAGEDSLARTIRIGPFAVWEMNQEHKRHEIFIYNGALRTRLEYVSYSSGARYFHKELQEEFRTLLQLQMQPVADPEDVHSSMDVTERAEKAEAKLKRGLLLSAEGKVEDALNQLELSVMYEPRASTYVEIAHLQKKAGDSKDLILHTLQRAIELEPDNQSVLQCIERVEDGDGDVVVLDDHDLWAMKDNWRFMPTLVHALTPEKYRSLCWLWWAGILTFYFFLSTAAELFFGQSMFLPSMIGMYVCTLVFTTGLPMARSLFIWLRLPLSQQLSDSVRMELFNKEYLDQGIEIFGNNDVISPSLKERVTSIINSDRTYWVMGGVWLVVIGSLIVIGTDSHKLPLMLFLKRLFDYALVVGWLYPCVRYIVKTTGFIYYYSNKSLKPMLTKINDEGLRSISALMVFNISLALLAYTFYFVPASFTHKSAVYSDLVVLLLVTVIVMIWSIGMPVMVKRAARRAKRAAVHTYSEHIERAFNDFLENPIEDRLSRYKWLVGQQKVIQRIGVWPLNWHQTLYLVVFSNALLVLICIHYILMRFGLWQRYL